MDFEKEEKLLVNMGDGSWSECLYSHADEVEGFHIVNVPFGSGRMFPWLTNEIHLKSR